MSLRPLVSIFCFCKNAEPTIRRHLEAIVKVVQHYDTIEYVVQDGASTDRTLSIIEEYRDTLGSRLRILSEPDSCSMDGFWRALSRCEGDIICASLADEELLPDAIPFVVDYFAQHPEVDVIHGDIFQTDVAGNIVLTNSSTDFDLFTYISHQLPMHFAASFFRKSALVNAKLLPFPNKYGMLEDDFFVWCYLGLSAKIVYVPRVFAKYAVHDDALSVRPDNIECTIRLRERFFENYFADPAIPQELRARQTECRANFYRWGVKSLQEAGYEERAEFYQQKFACPPQAVEDPVSSDSFLKVLLLSLPGMNTGDEPIFPLGIGYLLAALRLDERPVQALHYQRREHVYTQLPEVMQLFTPDVVGLTCTTFNRGLVRETCSWLRATFPDVRIVLGGVHVSFTYEQALREYGADYVVIGEGEHTFRELCLALEHGLPLSEVQGIAYLDTERLVVTPAREVVKNLDDLPMPDYSFAGDLMRKSGMGFVISSRGCPVQCRFCSTGSYWGQKVRVNSPRRIVDEMESLISRYGVKRIFFHDDTFNLGIARVREICAEITRRGLTVEWGVSCRVSPVSQEMIDLMVAAGCRHICWGIESGSEAMLARIGKRITLEQIRQAFECCRKYLGLISVGAFTMVGNPGESAETIAESVRFISSLQLTDPPSTAVLYILPGTKLYSDLLVVHPELKGYWTVFDDVPYYTLEHTMETLSGWARDISLSGSLTPFDRNRHFWNNILFGDIPEPTLSRPGFLGSELDRVIPPEIQGDEFYYLIQSLAAEMGAGSILEIGSSAGGGSTDAFVKGILEGKSLSRLFCMEVSRPRYAALEDRYKGLEFVRCYNVSSVPVDSFPSEKAVRDFYLTTTTGLNGYPLEKVLGWRQQDIDYIESSVVPQNGIELIKRENNIEYFDMVLIDGSEFTGEAELELVYGAEYILLDDINGFKNYRNWQRLLADPAYELVRESWTIRNGYAVFRKRPASLPVHFLTIVLNGEPFIRKHIETFSRLQIPWHWHIVEGVAELAHDTAWSLPHGGRIDVGQHNCGLSNDGTSEYLDQLVQVYPEQITIYRKPGGQFWDGKLEMVSAPLSQITTEALLWQVDVDEFWTKDQINSARELFLSQPQKTAAWYFCDYLVGPRLHVTSIDTYGNNRAYEWIRTWRYRPGDRWVSHEPPRLCRQISGGGYADLAHLSPFRHQETLAAGLVFIHQAYVLEKQLTFKEQYYGYSDALAGWQRLQNASSFPVMLRDYFPWVADGAVVDSCEQAVQYESKEQCVVYLRSDAIGDNVLASAMLPHLREKFAGARLVVVCQDRVAPLYDACPHIDGLLTYSLAELYGSEEYRQVIMARLNALNPDILVNSVYSRDYQSYYLSGVCSAPIKIAIEGDTCNLPADLKVEFDRYFTDLVPNDPGCNLELERHACFLMAFGIPVQTLQPLVWVAKRDYELAEALFTELSFDPGKTLIVFPGTLIEKKKYPYLDKVLRAFHGYSLLMMGGGDVEPYCDELCASYPGRAFNLAGKTSILQMAAVMSKARLYVGVDTSGAHIACAVGLPNVVVLGGGHFGRFLPYSKLTTAVWLPLECYNCNWQCRYSRCHCVADIRPDVVISAVKNALNTQNYVPTVYAQLHPLSPEAPPVMPLRKFRDSLYIHDAEVVEG